MADARVIFSALARAEPGFSHKEYKGTPQGRAGAISRVLAVTIKAENVYIELKCGPGKLTATGAITPAGKPETEVNIGLKLYEARRLAAAVLAYIRAWDVMRMLANKDAVSAPSTYLLVPTAAANGRTPTVENGPLAVENRPAGAERSERARNGNGRPLTRRGPAPVRPVINGTGRRATAAPVPAPSAGQKAGQGQETAVAVPAPPAASERPAAAAVSLARPEADKIAEAIYGPVETSPTPLAPTSQPEAEEQRPRYKDGAVVDKNNAAELATFERFVAEKQAAPASKRALQVYFRKISQEA